MSNFKDAALFAIEAARDFFKKFTIWQKTMMAASAIMVVTLSTSAITDRFVHHRWTPSVCDANAPSQLATFVSYSYAFMVTSLLIIGIITIGALVYWLTTDFPVSVAKSTLTSIVRFGRWLARGVIAVVNYIVFRARRPKSVAPVKREYPGAIRIKGRSRLVNNWRHDLLVKRNNFAIFMRGLFSEVGPLYVGMFAWLAVVIWAATKQTTFCNGDQWKAILALAFADTLVLGLLSIALSMLFHRLKLGVKIFNKLKIDQDVLDRHSEFEIHRCVSADKLRDRAVDALFNALKEQYGDHISSKRGSIVHRDTEYSVQMLYASLGDAIRLDMHLSIDFETKTISQLFFVIEPGKHATFNDAYDAIDQQAISIMLPIAREWLKLD